MVRHALARGSSKTSCGAIAISCNVQKHVMFATPASLRDFSTQSLAPAMTLKLNLTQRRATMDMRLKRPTTTKPFMMMMTKGIIRKQGCSC
jgi:hypothetical protein